MAAPDLAPVPNANEVVASNRFLSIEWFKWFNTLRDLIRLFTTYVHIVQGNPNGVEVGSVGHIALRRDGGAGTTLYVKESGTNTTAGWVGK